MKELIRVETRNPSRNTFPPNRWRNEEFERSGTYVPAVTCLEIPFHQIGGEMKKWKLYL